MRKLSLGQRMKCELIASLIHTPKVLFLDEPTIGLDVVMQKRVREFIKEYNKRYNATVILTSHYMDDVKEICERVIMINNKVTEQDLAGLGELVEFNHPRAVINVARDQVSKVASQLLQNFEIDDLDINEPKLENIIGDIFEGKGSA